MSYKISMIVAAAVFALLFGACSIDVATVDSFQEGIKCSSEKPCGKNLYCIGGKCVPKAAAEESEKDIACKTSANCPDPKKQECVKGVCRYSCASAPCPDGFECLEMGYCERKEIKDDGGGADDDDIFGDDDDNNNNDFQDDDDIQPDDDDTKEICDPPCQEGFVCYQEVCCEPQCEGKKCGDDGCGGNCGECSNPPETFCADANALRKYNLIGSCIDNECDYPYTDVNCPYGCDAGECKNCVPDCEGKQCGEDGCGGNCGYCNKPPASICTDEANLRKYDAEGVCKEGGCEYSFSPVACPYGCAEGACKQCEPVCEGKQCGGDGCGGSCGECDHPPATICIDDTTVRSYAAEGTCVSYGVCDYAPKDTKCAHSCENGACANCDPDCEGRECGDDGCGETCGSCPSNYACNVSGKCECRYSTCEGVCCATGEVCYDGLCCSPDCKGKQCGPDGCGGSCGSCPSGEKCSNNSCVCSYLQCGNSCCGANDVCVDGNCCRPQCENKECGDDGCGGSCGTCASGLSCQSGKCVAPTTCPDGGFLWKNNCYWLREGGTLGVNWKSAKDACASNGRHLVTFTSSDEEKAVVDKFNLRKQCFWIGCTDEAKEGTFVWVTGETFQYANWCKDQPNNYANSQHYCEWAGCANNMGECWNDNSGISTRKYYVCEKKLN